MRRGGGLAAAMTNPPAVDDSRAWPRWAARGSLLAAFVCFAMNCVFMQVTRNQPPQETELANQIVGWSSMAVVIGGIAAAACALAVAARRGWRETAVIAAAGLLLNGGIVLVTLWMLYQVSLARL